MSVIGLLIIGIWLGLPIIAIWQILSARRKFVDKTCPECDYDLTGASVGSPCPECGIIPAIARGRATDPKRVICRNCGQDLEGLQWDADCPECGLRSAALPRFRPRQSAFQFRAVLGGVLLAIWIGLTMLMVMGEIRNPGTTMQNAGGRARAMKQATQLQQQAAEPPDAIATTPPPDTGRD